MDVVRDVDCDYVEEQNLVSGYLAGRLSDEEADALEKHFFGCEKHWREVRAGEEVRTAMRRSRAEQGTPLTASKRSHQLAIWRMFAVAAALAAVAMGALLVMRTSRTSVTPPSRTPLEELAAIATGTRTTEGRLSLELPHVGIDRGSKS